MPGHFNIDEQKRQQQYLNWKASQNALNNLPKDVKTKGQGSHDRKALLTTVGVIAAIVVALVVLSKLGIL